MSENNKPPYVIFETRAVEDRAASVEQGHYVAKDVVFAVITPAGSKDRIEKVAEDWLKDLGEAVRQERFPSAWLQAYQQAHKHWLETREVPENGIPVSQWPGVSPAQTKMLLDLNLRSVEQVAEASEEAMSRMGMGGRALKAKAQAFLDAANSEGKLAGTLDALRQEVEALKLRDTQREAELKRLQAENDSLKKAK